MVRHFKVTVTTTDGAVHCLPAIARTSSDAIFDALTAFGDKRLDSFGDVRKVRAQAA